MLKSIRLQPSSNMLPQSRSMLYLLATWSGQLVANSKVAQWMVGLPSVHEVKRVIFHWFLLPVYRIPNLLFDQQVQEEVSEHVKHLFIKTEPLLIHDRITTNNAHLSIGIQLLQQTMYMQLILFPITISHIFHPHPLLKTLLQNILHIVCACSNTTSYHGYCHTLMFL